MRTRVHGEKLNRSNVYSAIGVMAPTERDCGGEN